MLKDGILVTEFGFPLVPEGKARVRAIITSPPTKEEINKAIECFTRVGKKSGLIKD